MTKKLLKGHFGLAIALLVVVGFLLLRPDQRDTPYHQESGRLVTLLPGHNIQAAVVDHPPGTRFLIKSGVHRLSTMIVPRDGNTFIGEKGAIISGAKLLDSFERQENYWVALGQTQEGLVHGECTAGSERCKYSEDLFFDDKPLKHVGSLKEVKSGTWYFDYQTDKIYFGDDPRGHKVETSVTVRAFGGTAKNVTIQGLIIEKFATPAQSGAIHGYDYDEGHGAVGWTIDSNEIRFNHGGGVGYGPDTKIIKNNIHHNGQIGIVGIGDNTLVEGNEIAYNNFAGFSPAWEAGGTKFWDSKNLVIRGNYAHHNNGPGLWSDYNNIHVLYENNRIEYNGLGIYHEVSYDAIIRRNIINEASEKYAGVGINLWNSSNVEVYENTISAWSGIIINHEEGIKKRSQQGEGGTHGPLEAKNISVHDNIITLPLGANTGFFQHDKNKDIFKTANIRFSRNIYKLDSQNQQVFLWDDRLLTFKEWQGYGQDTEGKFVGP